MNKPIAAILLLSFLCALDFAVQHNRNHPSAPILAPPPEHPMDATPVSNEGPTIVFRYGPEVLPVPLDLSGHVVRTF